MIEAMIRRRTGRGETPDSAPRWRLPITWALLAGFGGLVAVAVATVMLISIRVAQENTDQLLQLNASQRLDAAIGRIDRYLEPVADDVTFLAHQLSREGDLSAHGDPQTESLMRGSLGAIPQVVAMAFVRPDLTALRVRRERKTSSIPSAPRTAIATSGTRHRVLVTRWTCRTAVALSIAPRDD